MSEEKRRLEQEWLAAEKATARQAFPIPDSELETLFDAVESGLAEAKCDHSLRLTRRWLASHHPAQVERVTAWLEGNGGYCDCEVIFNAMHAWEEARE